MDAVVLSPDDYRLQWEGRTWTVPDSVSPGEVELGFPGVSVSLRGKFSRMSLRIWASSPDCYLNVHRPKAPMEVVRVAEGESEVTLVDLPKSAWQEVTVVRRTEAWQGVIRLRGIEVGSDFVYRDMVTRPKPRLMFIGDSITCGAGCDYDPAFPTEGSIANNADAAFGKVIGKKLNAAVHLISYGGRGLVRDWQGFTSEEINNAPDFFERATPDRPEAVWDHAQYLPHVVTICLGTNDFNLGVMDEQMWTSAYIRFVQRIREVYPLSQILLVTSPMHGIRLEKGDLAKREALAYYVYRVRQTLFEAGDTKVHWHRIQHQPGTIHDSHPTAHQHTLMAKELAPVIKRLIGSV